MYSPLEIELLFQCLEDDGWHVDAGEAISTASSDWCRIEFRHAVYSLNPISLKTNTGFEHFVDLETYVRSDSLHDLGEMVKLLIRHAELTEELLSATLAAGIPAKPIANCVTVEESQIVLEVSTCGVYYLFEGWLFTEFNVLGDMISATSERLK